MIKRYMSLHLETQAAITTIGMNNVYFKSVAALSQGRVGPRNNESMYVPFRKNGEYPIGKK